MRTSSNTKEGIKKAVEYLARMHTLFETLDEKNSDKAKKELVVNSVKFGSGMIKNQFTTGVFLQELLSNRLNNKKNDFAYCIQWKGSNFRINELVLYPSGLRTDRNECYLKEETEIDKVAAKNDRDLFGDAFILD
jgi:hypothetical protein